MQHWWKWLLGPSIACGALLLIGSMSLMCNTANNPSSHFAGISYAEAAIPADPSDGIITRVAGYSATYWPRWSTPATAIVPIVSVGTPGLRLGLAQVTGPKREVSRVKAVLQLDADFKSVRMKILVPSDSYTDLRRVQGTAVTGLVQYKLLDFSAHKSSASTHEMDYDSYYRDRDHDHDNGCGPDMNRGKSQWHKHQGQYKNRDKHDGGHKR